MSGVAVGAPEPLGATLTAGGVNFAVPAPNATGVEVCLPTEDGERRVALPGRTGDVWHVEIAGLTAGARYGYRVHGPFDPGSGHWFNPAKRLIDPWARAVDGVVDRPGFDAVVGARRDGDTWRPDEVDSGTATPWCVVVAAGRPAEARPRVPWEDTVIYEAHVRGLTMRHPEVPAHRRGTFAGIASDAVVAHLTGLGVTTLELMPVAQFADEPHLVALGLSNYWGYSPIGFCAPHASYSSAGTDGAQVTEFRAMTDALHRAGIEVILDVVFNHSGESGAGGPMLSLRGLDSAAYFCADPADRSRDRDVTGTGNTLDLSRPAMLRLTLDAMRLWVTELGVDGFRFDLAATLARRDGGGEFDPGAALFAAVEGDPVLADVKLIAEPWDVGPGGYRLGGFPSSWAEWNDRFRDETREFWRGNGGVARLATRLSGSSDLFGGRGRGPWSTVNFVTAHDGFTLADLVSYAAKRNEANGEGNRDGTNDNRSWNCGIEGPTDDPDVLALRRRQRRNLLSTLLLSLGTPMLVAGDEMGRTQGGNNNAYCQDNVTSWLDWGRAGAEEPEIEIVRRLLALRRSHPVLRRREFLDGRWEGLPDVFWFREDGRAMAHRDWDDPERRTLGMLLNGAAVRDPTGAERPSGSVILIVHGGPEPAQVQIPARRFGTQWEIALCTADPDRSGTLRAREAAAVADRSVLVLTRP